MPKQTNAIAELETLRRQYQRSRQVVLGGTVPCKGRGDPSALVVAGLSRQRPAEPHNRSSGDTILFSPRFTFGPRVCGHSTRPTSAR